MVRRHRMDCGVDLQKLRISPDPYVWRHRLRSCRPVV
jgi:hypothetical protein